MVENLGEPSSGQERQRAPRHKFDAQVEIEWGSSTIRGRVRDISSTGMFVTPTEPLWVGARFASRILLEPPIAIECTVKRVEPGRGIGVQMLVTVPGHQPVLDALIARLETH